MNYANKTVKLKQPIITQYFDASGKLAGTKTFNIGETYQCTEHTQETGDIWQDDFLRFTDGKIHFGGFMAHAVSEVKTCNL